MLSSKTLTGRITTSNTRLFAIRLEVSKATSMDIEHMILIANSLDVRHSSHRGGSLQNELGDEWTLWNDLGFSLYTVPSVCHVVATSDDGEKV